MMKTASHKTHLTVPEVASRWGVNVDKVRRFIDAGELRGINLAQNLNTRPRYRIKLEDVETFEQARSVVPIPKPTQRVRRAPLGDVPRRY